MRPPIDGRRPLFINGLGTSNCIPPPRLLVEPLLGEGGVRNETDGRRARSGGAKEADADARAASPAASGFSDERRSELARNIPGGPPPPPPLPPVGALGEEIVADPTAPIPAFTMSGAIDVLLGLPCIVVPVVPAAAAAAAAAEFIACILAAKLAACAPLSDSDPRRGCASLLLPLTEARRNAAAETDDGDAFGARSSCCCDCDWGAARRGSAGSIGRGGSMGNSGGRGGGDAEGGDGDDGETNDEGCGCGGGGDEANLARSSTAAAAVSKSCAENDGRRLLSR